MTLAKNHPLLAAFAQICLLRQGPQILPASGFLLGVVVALNLLVSTAGLLLTFGLGDALLRAVADAAIAMALAYLILLAGGRQARALQTLTALFGVGALIAFISLPFVWTAAQSGGQGGGLGGLLGGVLTAILFWSVAIIGGVFRHALSIGLFAGTMVAIAYVFMALIVFSFLFAG